MDTPVAETETGASSRRDVTLVSQEGVPFKADIEIARMSGLVNAMMMGEDGDDEEEHEIMLPHVKAPILSKVLEFCMAHNDSPLPEIKRPLQSVNMADVVPESYAKFVDELDQNVLFELVLAANYMDVKSLLDLTCAKVASMIKGKTTEEIRKNFGMAPEEEAYVRVHSNLL